MTAPVIYVDLKFTPEPKSRKLLGPTRSRWQPWSAIVLREGNFEALFKSTEKWTNEKDALEAIFLAFGADSIVYLRASEKGNSLIRHPEPWPSA